ncbi:MAG: RpiB/LacA/LacB family sugar-phosphate isomerase [Phascolarctobacterium sp.]|nr:RpiB/LacA/LacB family sugar-phosphate isomerase [Phascolarctobacterium sp.]
MKIAVLQGSSQKDKNQLIYEAVEHSAPLAEVINFGVFEEEHADLSYVETSLLIGLLISSGAVDFVVTGCSSGQGMMLACNAWPKVCCGYAPTPQDAFLFGRINGGNTVSLPLGLNFGWCGEVNLKHTLEALFNGEFGCGYPPKDSVRKKKDTKLLKNVSEANKRDMVEILEVLDKNSFSKALSRKKVIDYVLLNSKDEKINAALRQLL